MAQRLAPARCLNPAPDGAAVAAALTRVAAEALLHPGPVLVHDLLTDAPAYLSPAGLAALGLPPDGLPLLAAAYRRSGLHPADVPAPAAALVALRPPADPVAVLLGAVLLPPAPAPAGTWYATRTQVLLRDACGCPRLLHTACWPLAGLLHHPHLLTGLLADADFVAAHQARCNTLTPREVDVLALRGQGCKAKAIAGRLFIAHSTVQNHLSRARGKLCLRTGHELAHFARAFGLQVGAARPEKKPAKTRRKGKK